MRFREKVAVVTGGGMGMGAVHCLNLAKEGANVVVADINLPEAKKIAKQIKEMGRQSLAVKCDVSIKKEVEQMVKEAVGAFGKIDILVNNAGILIDALPEEMSEEGWDKTMGVNLKGQFLCAQAVGKQMIKQGGGKIVNIASVSGHRGLKGEVAYGPSKAGVLGLTKVLAIEWAKYKINVNSVSPQSTITQMILDFYKTYGLDKESEDKKVPLGRQNQPQDVTNAVLFLASDEADIITGADLVVDGGLCAVYPI